MAREWTQEMRYELARLVQGHTVNNRTSWQFIQEEMKAKFGEYFSVSSLRMQNRDYIAGERKKKVILPNEEDKLKVSESTYNEKIEFNNGQWQSDRLIQMSEEQKKDPDFLLEAHGFDPCEWELINAKSSLWHQRNKKDQFNTSDKPVLLYSNKITVKPREEKSIDWDEIIENIQSNVAPYEIDSDYIDEPERKHLIVPLYDMHFPITTYEEYMETQQDIINLFENGYHQILFVIGNDLFHHNDHRNRTASGREIQHADMTEAWKMACDFYEPILTFAQRKAFGVEVVYVPGNHDETFAWAFSKYLEARFPQIWFDNQMETRKVTMVGRNMIGMTHGDKAVKELPMLFATEFPSEWAEASNRETFIGHLHTEKTVTYGSEDIRGVTIRRMPTRNKADKWHIENGYTMANRRFQLVEYTDTETSAIYYV